MLTIIGLVIGGILVGRDLLRAAQLNAVVSEAARYTQAIADFREKYHALPGDFSGATALWGQASGGCPGGTATGTQTCDGNGDGAIMTVDDCPPMTPPNCWWGTNYEPFQAWQHLADAGMIDGSYNAIPTSGGYPYAVPGMDIPASQLSGAGWFVVTITL